MNFALTRKIIIFALVLPLAAILGFTLATPYESTTFLLIGGITGLLLMPIMLKWYHPLLIFTWNALINVYFLPGKPQLWMLITAIGFGIMVVNRAMDGEQKFIRVPVLTMPLLFFAAVVLITAKLTGGMGVRALGGGQLGSGTIGGKAYYMILFAILGYFVLTSRPIAVERAKNWVSLFFLGEFTGIISNLAYMLGPAFYFLFYLFPVDFAVTQVMSETPSGIVRITGLTSAGHALYFFMLARFGIRGILDFTKPWRLVFFLLTIFLSLFGGFRSMLAAFGVLFIIQFFLEGLLRTRFAAFLLLGAIAIGALSLPFVDKMPLPVQRCVAFIPGVPVDAVAKANAETSTQWRLEMWRVLLPEIPKYLIVGKGYALNPVDLYLAGQAQLRGLAKDYEVSLVAGAYHSGPLSVIIPFGIFGAIAVLWIMGAGVWVLYQNFRYGDPHLRPLNTFLLSLFLLRIFVFFFIFGGIEGDIHRFVGVLGLSVAINRGVRKTNLQPVEEPAGLTLQPASA